MIGLNNRYRNGQYNRTRFYLEMQCTVKCNLPFHNSLIKIWGGEYETYNTISKSSTIFRISVVSMDLDYNRLVLLIGENAEGRA